MADEPTFDGVRVPDRDASPSAIVDNVVVLDPSTSDEKHRQVVVAGDPIDHNSVARVLTTDPDDDTPGSVVRIVGTVNAEELENLLRGIYGELRKLRELVEMISNSE